MKIVACFLFGWMAAAGATGATGAGAQDPCSAATASVTITEIPVREDTIDAKGTWQAGGGAAGLLLEYQIDNDRVFAETRLGAEGTWDISSIQPMGKRCGRHTLRIYTYPTVRVGDRLLHCLQQGTSTPKGFEISCAPVAEIQECAWHCTADEGCTGVCTGTARRGRLRYVPFWGLNGSGWQQIAAEPGKGPWTFPVTCVPGQRVSFKVRDHEEGGPWSEVDEIGCGVTE